MSQQILLGIDIGTSACKVGAFSTDGTVVYQATEAYETFTPMPGYAEQDANDWWKAVCAAMQRMARESRFRAKDVVGIGVDGQSWAALPVDQGGNPLRRALIWLDRRSTQQCEWIRQTVGEDDVFSVSGNPLSPGYTTGKILWIRQHEPDIYRQTHQFLQCNSFIVYKMTGRFSQDVSQGYGVHVFDIANGSWNTGLCKRMSILPELLPPLFESSDIVGELTPEAAEACGLPAGIPVVAGGLDAACATLGVGVIHPGEVQEQGGQAGGMSIVVDRPVSHPSLILGRHVIPGVWLLQGGTVGGGSLRWLRRELAREFPRDEDFYDAVQHELPAIPVGSGGIVFLPYMAGERSPIWDIHARGVFVGLSYETTRAHFIKSVMEGCAFALRHNLMTAAETGVDITELRSMGGAANSAVWNQIKADVTGKVIKVPSSHTATTLGAALLAGIGVGIYKNTAEAVAQTVRIHQVYEPQPSHSRLYDEFYDIYLETYQRLKTLFPRLGG